MTESYRVLIGIDYPGHRAEPGDVVNDIPQSSVKWLLADGVIEPAGAKPPKPAKIDDGGVA